MCETGFLNLSDSFSTIRRAPVTHYFSGTKRVIPSFALAVVTKYMRGQGSAISRFDGGHDSDEIIRYLPAATFNTIKAEAILADPQKYTRDIENKIVLIGACGTADRHFTPLNAALGGRSFPDMDGIFVHSNIVHSILSNEPVRVAGTFRVYGIFALILLVLVPVFLYFFEKCEHIYHFPLVLFYEFITNVILVLVILSYYERHLYIESGTPVLMFHLVPFTCWLVHLLEYKFFRKKKSTKIVHAQIPAK
jgi:hypothetical protein